MIKPAHIQTTSFFYAMGNTPAVCLTKSLPPDQDVSLLLLGCGDVRNVLLTAYADLGDGNYLKPLRVLPEDNYPCGCIADSFEIENRKIDLTCCDIEPEIIGKTFYVP